MSKTSSKLIKDFKILENKNYWFLLMFSALFVVLRIPSLVEPYWYGDEGIYQVIGRVIKNGGVLYRDAWDNKPPLLYLIYGLFDGELFLVKFASLVTGLFTFISFFILSGFVFANKISRYVSSAVFVLLFSLPIIEGNIANAENFMLLPITVAAIYIFKYLKSSKYINLIIAGFFLSVALVIKIVSVFDFLAFTLFIIYQKKGSKNLLELIAENIKPILIFSTSFLSLIVISFFYFYVNSALKDFISGVFSENVSYVNVNNNFIFPLSFIFVKSIILIACLFLLLNKSNNISKAEVFIYFWFVFSLYNALFSQRPYIHYLLVLLPSFALLVGSIFEKSEKKVINILLVIGVIFLALNHFTIYKKNLAYYKNYLDFMFNKKSVDEYYQFFDSRTPNDYKIANFINASTKKSETVFLWSNSAQIYALTGKMPINKYVVAYHLTFYEGAIRDTIKAIEEKKPKLIIQTEFQQIPRGILANYKFKYMLDGALVYEREI